MVTLNLPSPEGTTQTIEHPTATQADLDQAVQVIRDYCGWHISPPVTETMLLDGTPDRELFLPTTWLTSVTSVTNEGQAVALADVEVSRAGILRGPVWSKKYGSITVTCTHGKPSWPFSIIGVIQHLLAQPIAGAPADLTSGPHKIGYTPAQQAGALGLSGHIRNVLDPYKVGARVN